VRSSRKLLAVLDSVINRVISSLLRIRASAAFCDTFSLSRSSTLAVSCAKLSAAACLSRAFCFLSSALSVSLVDKAVKIWFRGPWSSVGEYCKIFCRITLLFGHRVCYSSFGFSCSGSLDLIVIQRIEEVVFTF